jgi:PAS domain S-box-containing protein
LKQRKKSVRSPRHLPSPAPEQQSAWLAELVASSDDAIIGKTLRGIITSWNRGAERLFGYSSREAVGRSILFIIPRSIREEENVILAKIAAGEHVDHYETVRVRKDGSEVHVSITVSPIKDDSGLIIGASKIARDISDRKKAEQLLRDFNVQRQESEREILRATESERQRIGADLHDNVGQQLTAIEFQCHALADDLAAQRRLALRAKKIGRLLRQTVAQTRRLARGLMPISLQADGLVDGLAEMALQMSEGPTHCALICPFPIRIADDIVAHHLFRIAQEAVNNATRHGGAKKVTVTLCQSDESVTLRIDDDGKGFSPSAAGTSRGVGLKTMRHRANVIGATLEAWSGRKKGTRITCTVRAAA